jgi:hypothetical protein
MQAPLCTPHYTISHSHHPCSKPFCLHLMFQNIKFCHWNSYQQKDSPYIRSPQNNKDWTSNKRFNHNPFAKMSKLIVFFPVSNSTKQTTLLECTSFWSWSMVLWWWRKCKLGHWELTMLFFPLHFLRKQKEDQGNHHLLRVHMRVLS